MSRRQIRTYRIRPGAMPAWLELWRQKIVPLREKHGFRVLGAWSDEESGEFTWVLGTQDQAADFGRLLEGYEAEREQVVPAAEIAAHVQELVGMRMVDEVDPGR